MKHSENLHSNVDLCLPLFSLYIIGKYGGTYYIDINLFMPSGLFFLNYSDWSIASKRGSG